MKSLVYATNTATQAVALNGIINFGSLVRKFGCGANVIGGNLVVTDGYYKCDAKVTVTGTNAGTFVVTMLKDGVPITGATASATIAVGDVVTVSIPFVVRQKCCCESTITAVLSGVAESVTNAAIVGAKA